MFLFLWMDSCRAVKAVRAVGGSSFKASAECDYRMLLGKLKEIEVIKSDKCSSSFVLPTDAVCCVLLHYALLAVNFT